MKEFHSLEDWKANGITNLKELDKTESVEILKSFKLPTIEAKKFAVGDFCEEETQSFLEKYAPIIIICKPLARDLPKDGRMYVQNMNQILSCINNLHSDKYNIFLIEMIEPIKESYVGAAITDSFGNLTAEFLKKEFLTDIRKLVSGSPNPKSLSHLNVQNREIINFPKDIPKEDVNYLKRVLIRKEGYFEFIKGTKKGEEGIYFTDYQNSGSFMGPTYCSKGGETKYEEY